MSRIGPGPMSMSLVLVLAAGCGAQAPHGRPEVAQVAQGPDPVPALNGPAEPVDRKIIYTSQIELIVDDLNQSQQRLNEMLKLIQSAGGYAAKQEVSGQQGTYRRGTWTIRVPLSKFDSFVIEVERLGELSRDSRDAQDVTEAYADLDARLRNQQASESRLLAHLQKTGELKETLEVEREITRVRGEVERLQGQLNVLRNKTDLATIQLTLLERETFAPAAAAPTFSTQISRTFQTSINGLIAVVKTLMLIAVALIPWLMVAALLSLPVMIARRFVHSRRKTAS